MERHKDAVGLTVVHEPEGTPTADLVFVHGLGGGSVRSWSADDQAGTFWPFAWLTNESLLASTRISTYGYNSQAIVTDPDRLIDLSELAKELLAKLRFGHGREGCRLNIGSVPLIFVGYSLGGLIAKKAYLLARSDSNATYSEIAKGTAAFVFFSTPHRGLHESSIINDLLASCVPDWQSARKAEIAQKHTLKLHDINETFQKVAASHASALDIYSFYSRPLPNTQSGNSILTLPSQITTLDLPEEQRIPLDGHCSTITKYTSRNDSNYVRVTGALRALVDKFKSRRRSLTPEDATVQAAEVHKLLQGCEAPQDDLSFFSDKRVEGSCEWMLDQPVMEAFLVSDVLTPECLWCYGGPGSGKSVSATYLIEHLQEENRICAFYYFRSGNQVKNSLAQFMLSIASQLSQQLPEYRRKLLALAADRFDVGKAGHKLLWKKLILTALLQCSPKSPICIVIDGLDELPTVKELLQKLLTELGDSRNRLRLLLVSRPIAEIETAIERLAKRMRVQRLALDRAEDLALYVQEEMDVMLGDDDFKERIIMQVLEKADRNFLWAHLVVQEILECQTEGQVESALQQVPEELESLYENMDRRIADTLRSRPQDQAMGHTIMKWSACARRPLHLTELETALEDRFPRIMDMRQTVQRLCGEFVNVDKKGYVSMMHASARESLMSNFQLNYHISAHETHHTLFTRCVEALIANHGGTHVRHNELHQSFLTYAASSWPYHLIQSSDFGDQISIDVLLKFLSGDAVLTWLSMMAMNDNLRMIVEASRALSRFMKIVDLTDREISPLMHRLEDKETIQLWSQDLIRVVGKFGSQIVKQPMTVYDLMPAFSPKASILYKQFCDKQASTNKQQLRVRGRLNRSWDDCFAKFAVPGDALPHSVMSTDRHFAILTKGKDGGVVHLYNTTTCDAARCLTHGEPVLAWCVDPSSARIATYGFKKTKVWDIESGRPLISIENHKRSQALAMTFKREPHSDDMLMILTHDRVIRACSLDVVPVEWEQHGTSIDNDIAETYKVNSPHNAQFSPDGLYIATSYRGASPSVWYMGDKVPRHVAHCGHRARRSSAVTPEYTRSHYAKDFAWNSLTGHLLGIFNDGLIFKWHPTEDDFVSSGSDLKGDNIKCSVDGKLFVTSTVSGLLRIWDFEHFVPIYEMSYPVPVQDLDIGWNEARIYDIREQHCNIWEPGSLLRAMESDDASIDSLTLAPDAQRAQENFEPVTAFAVMDQLPIYASGNDAGGIAVCDFDGVPRLELEESLMSIEQFAWCTRSSMLAHVDLSREIIIRRIQFHPDEQQLQARSEIVCSFSEVDAISQILFNNSGQRLMVVTSTHLKVCNVLDHGQPLVVPAMRPSRWITHPTDDGLALGFGVDQVIISSWTNLISGTAMPYETAGRVGSNLDQATASFSDLRRASMAYPTSPSEIDQTVNKVLLSLSSTLALIEIYGTARQARRRSNCLLIDLTSLKAGNIPHTVAVCDLPRKLTDILYVCLGFTSSECLAPAHRRPSAAEQRRSMSRLKLDESDSSNTFAFVDRDFWVCSADIGFGQGENVQLRRHFFLPRDWQNTEWLEMATVTKSGDVLCPRNGDVAVVSHGFSDEFEMQGSEQ